MLVHGLPLASIAALLILYSCGATNPEDTERNATDKMKSMKQAEENSALEVSIPPIDKIVPDETETATFGFG